jgi:hypothetical protein
MLSRKISPSAILVLGTAKEVQPVFEIHTTHGGKIG